MFMAGPCVGSPGNGADEGGKVGEEGQEYEEGRSCQPVAWFLDRIEGGNENRPTEKDAWHYDCTEVFC